MALTVTLVVPGGKGNPLPSPGPIIVSLSSRPAKAATSTFCVKLIVIDEATGGKTDVPTVHNSITGNYEGTFVGMTGKYYTVAAFGLVIDSSGTVTDSDSDVNINCQHP